MIYDVMIIIVFCIHTNIKPRERERERRGLACFALLGAGGKMDVSGGLAERGGDG